MDETLSRDMRQFWLDLTSVPLTYSGGGVDTSVPGCIRAVKAGPGRGDCPIEAAARVRFPDESRISGAHTWGSTLFGYAWTDHALNESHRAVEEFVQDIIWAADIGNVNSLDRFEGSSRTRRRVYRRILEALMRDTN